MITFVVVVEDDCVAGPFQDHREAVVWAETELEDTPYVIMRMVNHEAWEHR